jgi:plastocyanin
MIAGYQFEPAQVTVRAGTTVRWINREKRTSHSVYFTGQDAFESDRLFPGESWSYRFELAGVRDYHCGPHPEMRGRIVVTE